MAVCEASHSLKLFATVVIVFLTVVHKIVVEAEMKEGVEERGAEARTALRVAQKRIMAYVANRDSDTVSVINTATNRVIATVPVESNPRAVTIAPDGTKVYVANRNSGTVSVINTLTNQMLVTLSVRGYPSVVGVALDGTKVYIVDEFSNSISVIDTATNQVQTIIAVGVRPFAIAMTPDGSKAYVVNYGSNTVSVINIATDQVIATVSVGSMPRAVVMATVVQISEGSHGAVSMAAIIMSAFILFLVAENIVENVKYHTIVIGTKKKTRVETDVCNPFCHTY
jgi:YVTN family beta-propeller protein